VQGIKKKYQYKAHMKTNVFLNCLKALLVLITVIPSVTKAQFAKLVWLDEFKHKGLPDTNDLSKAFHVYAIKWTENRIGFFIDKVK
jgi:hypothetical protein